MFDDVAVATANHHRPNANTSQVILWQVPESITEAAKCVGGANVVEAPDRLIVETVVVVAEVMVVEEVTKIAVEEPVVVVVVVVVWMLVVVTQS